MTVAIAPRRFTCAVCALVVLLIIAPGARSDTIDVSIDNFAFVPSTVTIAIGDAVRWTNLDATAHTTTAIGGEWDSGALGLNGTFVFTFTTEGTFDYICTIHPIMTGSVVVTAVTGVDDEEQTGLPDKIEVSQNYPNPFNPTTTFSYALAERSHVRVTVYNIAGQEVRTLHNGEQPAGQYEITWNGTDSLGTEVASGIYLYRVMAGDFSETRKMVLIR